MIASTAVSIVPWPLIMTTGTEGISARNCLSMSIPSSPPPWSQMSRMTRVGCLAWIAANHNGNLARLAKGAARLARATTLSRDIPASRVLTEDRISSVRCPVLGIYGGDSLWGIAVREYGPAVGPKMVNAITAANPKVRPDALKLGTELTLPAPPDAPAIA